MTPKPNPALLHRAAQALSPQRAAANKARAAVATPHPTPFPPALQNGVHQWGMNMQEAMNEGDIPSVMHGLEVLRDLVAHIQQAAAQAHGQQPQSGQPQPG